MRTWRLLSKVAIVASALLVSACSSETTEDKQGEALPDPLAATTIEYLINGEFNPAIPPPGFETAIPGAFPGLWVTDYPYTTVLGWTKEQVDAEEQKAIAFFVERFGVDPTAAEWQGKVAYSIGMSDPRWNYRAYKIPGRNVPAEGYTLWDISFNAWVIDPAGIVLGGQYAGQTAGPGSGFVYGHYIIDTGSEKIVVALQSHRPVVSAPNGMAIIECEIQTDDFGSGIAQAVGLFEPVGTDGTLRITGRNMLTFAGL